MKKQLNIKKLILLNLPYILMGLFSTNFGEAWRMAVGADASAKMLSFFSTLPVALASWWPSLHPLDLLVGLCCGAGLRLAVYLKSKNAKVKSMALPSALSACMGITEPAIFGVNLRYFKPFIGGLAGGACGALYASVTGLGATGTGVTGIFGILLHLHMPLQYLIMMAISFGVSFAVTWVICTPEAEEAKA